MLLEIAIGDAYGAGHEFVDGALSRNDLSGYVAHPHHAIAPGSYTDDTQMSIAIAELLVEKAPFTAENVAEKFVTVFHRDPREGYARGFHAFLGATRTGADFLRTIRPHSKKSGAAMRAAPIGVLADTNAVIAFATLQARVTHDTEEGRNAAIAALTAHYCFHGLGPKRHLAAFVADHVAGDWAAPWSGPVGSDGMSAVRAAITAVLANGSLAVILRAAVAFGGDTDTVAAIAMGAASHCREVKRDLPAVLARNLENGTYGRAYIEALDAKLIDLG